MTVLGFSVTCLYNFLFSVRSSREEERRCSKIIVHNWWPDRLVETPKKNRPYTLPKKKLTICPWKIGNWKLLQFRRSVAQGIKSISQHLFRNFGCSCSLLLLGQVTIPNSCNTKGIHKELLIVIQHRNPCQGTTGGPSPGATWKGNQLR